jgi:hypothetical protein
MSLTSKKWLIPLLLIIIVVLLSYFAIDLYGHFIEDTTCTNPESGQGTGQGQGRLISQTYLLLLVGSTLFILCVVIPLIYLLLSRNVKKQLERNTNLITEIVNKNNSKPTHEDNTTSSKILFLKFLSYAENKVIKKLIENNGTILQSEISRMETMGKVRTHRVITELKKKEVIIIEPYGKTNRITLTDDAKNVLLK